MPGSPETAKQRNAWPINLTNTLSALQRVAHSERYTGAVLCFLACKAYICMLSKMYANASELDSSLPLAHSAENESEHSHSLHSIQARIL